MGIVSFYVFFFFSGPIYLILYMYISNYIYRYLSLYVYIYINYYYTYLPHQLYMYIYDIYLHPLRASGTSAFGRLGAFPRRGSTEVALCTAGLFWAVRILFVAAGLDGLKLGNTGDIMM